MVSLATLQRDIWMVDQLKGLLGGEGSPLSEVAVPRQLFAQILERIARLCPTCVSG